MLVQILRGVINQFKNKFVNIIEKHQFFRPQKEPSPKFIVSYEQV